jgi:hypothetical protein
MAPFVLPGSHAFDALSSDRRRGWTHPGWSAVTREAVALGYQEHTVAALVPIAIWLYTPGPVDEGFGNSPVGHVRLVRPPTRGQEREWIRALGAGALLFVWWLRHYRRMRQLFAAACAASRKAPARQAKRWESLGVQLAGGTATFIAPIRLNGRSSSASPASQRIAPPVSSDHALSRNAPLALVTVIRERQGDTIGPMTQGGSDIAFNRAGILFTWLPQTSQLGTVNLDTGAVTPIGNPGAPGPPAGLAIDDSGVAYVTPKGATGTLDSFDIATGTQTTGPMLTGAPFDSTINSMTFTPSGLLLAVNSNSGSPSAARLVTINVSTGASPRTPPPRVRRLPRRQGRAGRRS